jgi:bacillithiol biosynthesis deacetylase BshB1
LSSKLKFLFFGAHPDDVEMGAAGTIIRLKKAGHWIGVVDLSKGEMGTRGTAESRTEESKCATEFLKLDYRTNLNLGDGNINSSKKNRSAVIDQIRKHKPDFVFCNAPKDRHIDHGYAAELVLDACFLSGLKKFDKDEKLEPHRPQNIFHYIQDYYLKPSLVIDITAVFDDKLKAMMCYKTQFFQGPATDGPQTPISSPEFLEFFNGRASQMGRLINTRFGEGFIANQPLNMDGISWF